MRTAKILVLSCVVIVLIARVSFAKRGNIGIYAIVDKIVFEPNDSSPKRIQIWGLFVVPVRMSSGEYRAPDRGVLYFRIAPGMEEAARKEWAELKAMAGTGRAFGFTNYWMPDPTDSQHSTSLEVHVYRNADLCAPNSYPLGIGIVKTNEGTNPDFDRIVAQLKATANRP
jgi:hypothetical protein